MASVCKRRKGPSTIKKDNAFDFNHEVRGFSRTRKRFLSNSRVFKVFRRPAQTPTAPTTKAEKGKAVDHQPSVSSLSTISIRLRKKHSLSRNSGVGPPVTLDRLLLCLHRSTRPSKRNRCRSVSRRPDPTFPREPSAAREEAPVNTLPDPRTDQRAARDPSATHPSGTRCSTGRCPDPPNRPRTSGAP